MEIKKSIRWKAGLDCFPQTLQYKGQLSRTRLPLSFRLEEVIWIYLAGALGVLYLIKQRKDVIAAFTAIFFFSIIFVSHRDLARYALPLVPFLFIAFARLLSSREFKWVMALLIIPIYLFAIAFIAGNVTPIPDWGPLL